MARFSSVFVLGVAHCGSTLLGRLLDSHPDLLCVGELLRLGEAIEKGLPCSCGASLEQCELWGARLESLASQTGRDWRGFEPGTFARLGAELGAATVVDLSKTLVWRRGRRWKSAGDGYVLLLRDPRGIMAATVRAGGDLAGALAKHVKWKKRLQRFCARRGERVIRVRYEDLCLHPRRELERLVEFLGVAFADEMLRPADREHHFVHSSRSPYLAGSNEIRLDQRWQRELTPEALATIEAAMRRVPLLASAYLGPTPA